MHCLKARENLKRKKRNRSRKEKQNSTKFVMHTIRTLSSDRP